MPNSENLWLVIVLGLSWPAVLAHAGQPCFIADQQKQITY